MAITSHLVDDDSDDGAHFSEIKASFQKFVEKECVDRIQEIIRAPDTTCHYAVDIDLAHLEKSSPFAALAVLERPKRYLKALTKAVSDAIAAAVNGVSQHDPQVDDVSVKRHVHARVCHLPTSAEVTKPNVSMLRTRDVGKILAVVGTVTRTGSVMLREVEREYMCTKCKHQFKVEGDITQRGAFDLPGRCPSYKAAEVSNGSAPDGDESEDGGRSPPGRGRGRWRGRGRGRGGRSGGGRRRRSNEPCMGSSFVPAETGPPVCREYQEIKVQEKIQNLDVGSIPRSLLVVLTDDLADSTKPGDDVVVSGILYRRWNKPLSLDTRCDVQLMLVAVHIATNNEQKSFLHITEEARQQFASHWASHSRKSQLRARDTIIRSICPQIYGMYLLKLILAMSLVGGVSYKDRSGSRIRGESHLLIVGDPGTAKSQFLRYAAKVSPRSVLTTGIGTTSAGLTVTAVREPGTGEWMLDAGALVLADGGICCIDEFDGIREHDRGAIHEAMEQQTLSVAKAGLVCTLDTRATVIAAVNPKGGKISTEIGGNPAGPGDGQDGHEVHLPISVGIASPLLSRFDVILTLLDQKNEEWDRQLSNFILNNYNASDAPGMRNGAGGKEEIWPAETLQQYIFFVKCQLKPRLSMPAQRLLTKYYTMERAAARRNAARTTVRLLEALVRLAQAHARLMFRETATAMDGVFAIAAVEASAAAQHVVGGMGALHAPFPEDPDKDFATYAGYILTKLGLEGEIDFEADDEDAPV